MTAKQMQHLLAYLGYYIGTIDGKWGVLSREAAARFQEDYSLKADGIFGKRTEQKILEVIGSGVMAAKSREPGDFWAETEYFSRSEFACPCGRCGGFPAEPEEKLVRLADRVREHFGAAAYVSSGVRCGEHNEEVGGVANSRHKLGKAMDFHVSGFSAAMVLAYVKILPGVRYAYAIDGSYVHMDVE